MSSTPPKSESPLPKEKEDKEASKSTMTDPLPAEKKHKRGLTAKGDQRQYVKHSYTDRSNDLFENLTESDENTLRLYREDSVGGTFPIKLQIVLKVVEKIGQQHIVSWLPHGRAFMIHRPREFEDEVMGKYFKQTKLTSFQRQLNLYDFQRITHGRDAGSYYHELFLRGRPLLAKRMIRRKVKGTKIRASSSPDDEPNFYVMPFMSAHEISSKSAGGITMGQDSMLRAPSGNRSSVPDLQGSNLNDTLGLSVPRSLNAGTGGAYGQAALHQLGNHPSSLANNPFLNPLQAPNLPNGSLYPGLMSAYGANRLPLSTLTGSIENLHYSNALSSTAFQREYLNRSLGASPYDQLTAAEAMYKTDLGFFNSSDVSQLDNMDMMGGYGSLQASAAAAAAVAREQRIAQLNQLAIANDNLNSQLFHQQLQAQQRQQESQFIESFAPLQN
eukprot:CAMPEP_0203664038 /NCGR_PEP_ID=MMETSP0090-20130426/1533_1 /ASSEMBLY_ACC=CAM_ASM_001088 /TAXON_ID=426623 /ORGANISM="Chaetoceros affinis, Strain CCMP159" /LENGTH=442 /DNA_ID=CAMNT_0050527141 /DNA_START=61 /DNA_END=1389 /DNA_ORIENTATION=-